MENKKQQKLFNLGQEQLRKGNFGEAKRHLKKLCHLTPSAVQPKILCAVAYKELGKLDKAEHYIEQVLKLDPKLSQAWFYWGQIQGWKNNMPNAIKGFKKAIELKADIPEFYLALGNAELLSDCHEDAIKSYNKVVSLDTGNLSARLNLAKTHRAIGNIAEAERVFQSTIDGFPSVESTTAYSEFLYSINQYERAFDSYNSIENIASLRPTDLFNFIECAIQAFRAEQLLQRIKPILDNSSLLVLVNFGLSRLFAVCGSLEVAEQYYSKACKQDPRYVNEMVQMLSKLPRLPDTVLPSYSPVGMYIDYQRRKFSKGDWQDYNTICQQILVLTKQTLDEGRLTPLEPNFALYMQNDDPMLEYRVAHNYALYIDEAVRKLDGKQTFEHASRKRNRIRLGLVSPVFREHAMTILCVELLELIDKSQFELFWYGLEASDNSVQARRIASAVDHCFEMVGDSNIEVAEKIYSDQIDLLIDIYGYGPERRTEVFALRPAPIIIQHIGYPSTMGAPWVDYMFATRTLIPSAFEKAFAEKIVFLPTCRNVVSGFNEAASSPSRVDLDLPENGIVLASMHQAAKLTPQVVNCWLDILREVPETVLWLLRSTTQLSDKIVDLAKKKGVDSDRIIFGEFCSPEQHIARMRQADVVLDTIAFGGFNSNVMALWAGVPVVTLKGNTFATRIAADACISCGLYETVTETLQQYKETVIKLATEKEWRYQLKARLADPASLPLFDAQANVEAIEEGFRRMFSRWNQGRSPESIEIKPGVVSTL